MAKLARNDHRDSGDHSAQSRRTLRPPVDHHRARPLDRTRPSRRRLSRGVVVGASRRRRWIPARLRASAGSGAQSARTTLRRLHTDLCRSDCALPCARAPNAPRRKDLAGSPRQACASIIFCRSSDRASSSTAAARHSAGARISCSRDSCKTARSPYSRQPPCAKSPATARSVTRKRRAKILCLNQARCC